LQAPARRAGRAWKMPSRSVYHTIATPFLFQVITHLYMLNTHADFAPRAYMLCHFLSGKQPAPTPTKMVRRGIARPFLPPLCATHAQRSTHRSDSWGDDIGQSNLSLLQRWPDGVTKTQTSIGWPKRKAPSFHHYYRDRAELHPSGLLLSPPGVIRNPAQQVGSARRRGRLPGEDPTIRRTASALG